MSIYLAQCVPGLQDAVWSYLPTSLGHAVLHSKEEGFLAFEADATWAQVASLRYLNNCYLVLASANTKAGFASAMRAVLAGSRWHEAVQRSRAAGEHAFRVVLSDENQLVAGDAAAIAELRRQIAGLTGLRDVPRGGDAEFWILRRRSGQVFFCKRLRSRQRTERDLLRGELRPELAHLLCLLSEPAAGDIFLDPFAGSGAIPLARTFYPYNMIFASDSAAECVKTIKSRVSEGKDLRLRERSPFIVRAQDALRLERIEAGFIDKLVTDPPWGLFGAAPLDLPGFYRSMLQECCRVVKSGGLLIVLLADRELAEELSREFSVLEPLASYPLLVAGKKAVIRKWRKR